MKQYCFLKHWVAHVAKKEKANHIKKNLCCWFSHFREICGSGIEFRSHTYSISHNWNDLCHKPFLGKLGKLHCISGWNMTEKQGRGAAGSSYLSSGWRETLYILYITNNWNHLCHEPFGGKLTIYWEVDIWRWNTREGQGVENRQPAGSSYLAGGGRSGGGM